MLKSIHGKRIKSVPHADTFAAAIRQLGPQRAAEIREALDNVIEDLPPDCNTNLRTFSSSFLGSELTPWPHPISHLYDLAGEIEGANTNEERIQERAALLFGQFIWECIMNRGEEWVFYDPNLDPRDPNRELTGKVYFEQGS